MMDAEEQALDDVTDTETDDTETDDTETDGIETDGIETDDDEELDKSAQGESGTSDATSDGTGEIDALGKAAGFSVRDDKPFRGIEEIDRRDDRRWELDPSSAEDAADR